MKKCPIPLTKNKDTAKLQELSLGIKVQYVHKLITNKMLNKANLEKLFLVCGSLTFFIPGQCAVFFQSFESSLNLHQLKTLYIGCFDFFSPDFLPHFRGRNPWKAALKYMFYKYGITFLTMLREEKQTNHLLLVCPDPPLLRGC